MEKHNGVIVKLSIWRVSVFFFYIFILSQVACSQEAVHPSPATGNPVETEAAARQLRIYRDALQQGSTEDIRVDAAVGLLLQNDAESREILLSALESDDNPQARQAVCQALIISRGLSQTIHSLEVFREPLLQILQSESVEQAQLAAEAMLLFDYSDVAGALDDILHGTELGRHAQMNAIYALQLRPEPTALRSLIKVLDDPDAEVAKAAETALQEAFGIPVGTSREVWSGILDELQLKSPEEIRRERLLRQEMKLRQVQAECSRWQKLYLGALDKQYESLDEARQGAMILDMIGSDLEPIRRWALGKSAKYPVKSAELREKLLSLLSDESRNIRLETAKVLMNKSDLDPGKVLLDRFQQEKDPEVALAMFDALGEACFYAFSPGSPVELSTEIKARTLEIATGYLESESAVHTIKGAEVIRKILELNNLSNDSMQSYLELLDYRYARSLSQESELRAELLSILAHLCGQGGAKEPARILFEPLFIEAVVVENDSALRLAAVQGLSYVDQVEALKLFKQNGLMYDESPSVQQVVIDVAGQTGDASDLEWLLELLGSNGHNGDVWAAVKSICQRQKAAFLTEWLPTLEAAGGVTDEYVYDILEIAEQKAAGEKNAVLQVEIQQQILSRMVDRKAWDLALTYLDKIGYDPANSRFSEPVKASVLKVLLYSKAADRAASVIQAELGEGDLSDAGALKVVLNDYFGDEAANNDDKLLLLKKINSISSGGRPNWSAFLGDLEKQLNSPTPEGLDEPIIPEGEEGE